MASEVSSLVGSDLSHQNQTQEDASADIYIAAEPFSNHPWACNAWEHLVQQPWWSRGWWTKERTTVLITVATVTFILIMFSCSSATGYRHISNHRRSRPVAIGVSGTTYSKLKRVARGGIYLKNDVKDVANQYFSDDIRVYYGEAGEDVVSEVKQPEEQEHAQLVSEEVPVMDTRIGGEEWKDSSSGGLAG